MFKMAVQASEVGTVLKKLTNVVLTEEDVPGAKLTKPFAACSVPELRRWLKCRGASVKGRKAELLERYK